MDGTTYIGYGFLPDGSTVDWSLGGVGDFDRRNFLPGTFSPGDHEIIQTFLPGVQGGGFHEKSPPGCRRQKYISWQPGEKRD
jgi:hypothetical protein